MSNSKIVREAVAFSYKGVNGISINRSVMEDENDNLALAIAQSFRKRLDDERCYKGIIVLNDHVRTLYFINDANEIITTVQVVNLSPDFKKLADRTLAVMVKGREMTFEGTLFDSLVNRAKNELTKLIKNNQRTYCLTDKEAAESVLFDVIFADFVKKEVGFALSPFEPTEKIKAQFNDGLLSFDNYGVEFRQFNIIGTSASVPVVVIKKKR